MNRSLDLLAALVALAPTDATLVPESELGSVLTSVYGQPEGQQPTQDLLDAVDLDMRTLVQALGYATMHEVAGGRVVRVTDVGRIYAARIAGIDSTQPMPLGDNPFGQAGVI